MLIRRATEADAEAMRQIYNSEVTGSTATLDLVPRTAAEQTAWMAAHAGVYPVVVAIADGTAPGPAGSSPGSGNGAAAPDGASGAPGGALLGFASLSPYRPRPGYATAVEDSIYVAAEHRGGGVGKDLLGEAVVLARDHGFHSIVARVVAEQPASVALHRACGFELVGIEREIGRKFGRWLDVAILQRLH